MNDRFPQERASGILAHITSLPSPYGIGDLGPGASRFLRFLAAGGQSIWQLLPLGPTNAASSHSPYMTVSAFAGNPLLISPALLCRDGLLEEDEIAPPPELSPYSVDFTRVTHLKDELLQRAFTRFKPQSQPLYELFREQAGWLEDYCLFMAAKTNAGGLPWYRWDKDLVLRRPAALADLAHELGETIAYYRFEQFIFWQQWRLLRSQAKQLGIRLFGDVPIYVSLDSADVWANQDIFQLDARTGLPTHVAGVPPDYFSADGQKWGNPLYRWNSTEPGVAARLLDWWTHRFRAVFDQVDIARIDHFRGFQDYWAVPFEEETALNGSWQPGPGKAFFDRIEARLGVLDIVAEDLGDIDETVTELRDDCGFPGMRVLQFAFDGNTANTFLPYNYETANTIVYTGTHDNNTTVGWFLSDRLDDESRTRVKRFANRDLNDHHGVHRDLIYLAMSSIAAVSIFPLQDILGFGEDCRMNMPGTSADNWAWRCSEEFLNEAASDWLLEQTKLFGRLPAPRETDPQKLSPDETTNP